MKTAVIYARYSSDSQTEQSIEGQLRVCKEYAERNDILILDQYIDRAMTGTNDNRPDFQRMIKDSSNKKWDYVLVYKLDRFSRNKYETAKYKKELKDNGIKLLSAMENIPDTPEGIILESLLEGMAEYYSAELAQKVKRGMHETRLKGYFQGGKLLYGYKLDGRKIVIDENEAEIVKYIFNQYANGKFVSQIILDLTNKGILNKDKPFKTGVVYNILKNEKYTGVYLKDEVNYENMYPRIIDENLYNKVKSKQKLNHYGKRSIKTTYLLKNKLTCGYCGKSISAETGTAKSGKKINYYKCIGIKKYRNGCKKETIRQDELEKLILDALVNELNKPKNIDLLVKRIIEFQNIKKTNVNLNLLTKNKKQAELALNNLLQALKQGITNKTTNSRMKELESQIEDLDRMILLEQGKQNIKLTENEIRKYYKEALMLEPLTLINYLVKQIILYNDKIEIILNSPSIESPNNMDSPFLSISKKIRKTTLSKLTELFKDIEIHYYI